MNQPEKKLEKCTFVKMLPLLPTFHNVSFFMFLETKECEELKKWLHLKSKRLNLVSEVAF